MIQGKKVSLLVWRMANCANDRILNTHRTGIGKMDLTILNITDLDYNRESLPYKRK